MHQLIGTSGSNHETNPVKTYIIRERVVKSYENVWNDRLDHEIAKDRGGKLGSYRKIKMNFQYEEYLDTVKNGQHRKALSKLRTSSHRLRIETGRYTSPKTDREDRVCVKCHALGYSHVDDEMHFLLDCKFLGYDQKLLLDVANLKCKNFSNLSQEEKYFYMVDSGGEMCRVVAKFCIECFRKKGNDMNDDRPALCLVVIRLGFILKFDDEKLRIQCLYYYESQTTVHGPRCHQLFKLVVYVMDLLYSI